MSEDYTEVVAFTHPTETLEWTMNEYQSTAYETAVYFDVENIDRIAYSLLGLCGEAGEVADKYKKVLRGDRQRTVQFDVDMALELGDVLWYLSAPPDRDWET